MGAHCQSPSRATKEIMVSDRSGKAKAFAEELGIVYSDAETIAARCDRIFIAVKPHMVQEVLSPLQKVLGSANRCSLPWLAGMEVRVEQLAGTELPVIRIMPNTPTAIGKGVIPYCRNALVEDETLNDWREDMRFCGLLDALEERLIDAASALSGSGPAFMYMFVEALADGARGLRPTQSQSGGVCRYDHGGFCGNAACYPPAPRRAEGRGVFSRRQHHCRRSGAGKSRLPRRCDGLRDRYLQEKQRAWEIKKRVS